MQHIASGMMAGFIAIIVLSALMVLKSMMGIMPELDIPWMISAIMAANDGQMTGWTMYGHMGGGMGYHMNSSLYGWPGIGWVVRFMIGIVVFGGPMALLDERLPGNSRIGHGLIIGALGWLVMMAVMMAVMMPMAGAGLFGMKLGVMVPMMTLLLHLIFGGVLGWVYALLIELPGANAGESV